jgi:hypothetical protein
MKREKYEQTTHRKLLLKYFDVEHWSGEKNFYGRENVVWEG